MRTSIKWWIGIAVVLLLAGAALWLSPWDWGFYTDGLSIRQKAGEATLRYVVWEEPELVPGEFNSKSDVYEPTVSADGLRMIFPRGRAEGQADLYLVHRNPANQHAWGQPEPISQVNTESDELGPALSSDGNYLYFYSNRPGGKGDYDLWVARWNGYTWVEPVNLGTEMNSVFREYGPAITPHGDRLYFSSNRPQPSEYDADDDAWRATLRELIYASDYDIFVADIEYPAAATNATGALPAVPVFKRVRRVEQINSPKDEGQVVVTPREDFIYFSSNRDGGQGGYDIYRSRFMHGGLTEPQNIGKPVNTKHNEMDPSLYYEGFGIVYSSNKDQLAPHTYRLFASMSRDVVLKRDYSKLAWLSNFFNSVKWWLLLLLAALAALVYILRLLMDPRLRQSQSLLHKCILISILAHMVLLFVLSLWIISHKMIEQAGEPPMQVSVDVRALAQEKLAMEIHEDVTEIPQPKSKPLVTRETWEQPEVELRPETPAAEPLVWRTENKSYVEKMEIEEPERSPDERAPEPLKREFDQMPEMEIVRNTFKMPELQREKTDKAAEKPIEIERRQTSMDSVEQVKFEDRPQLEKVDIVLSRQERHKSRLPLDRPEHVERRHPEDVEKYEATDTVLTNMPSLDVEAAIAMETPRVAKPMETERTLPRLRMASTQTRAEPGFSEVPIERREAQKIQIEAQVTPRDRRVSAVETVGVEKRKLPTPKREGIAKVASVSLQSPDIKPLFRMDTDKKVNIPYSLRESENRALAVERLGGSSETEKAVRHALEWFARHQSPDGHWAMEKFGGEKNHEMSSTSFALLCYFGWGIKHNQPGEFKQNVSKGIEWVLATMKENGDLQTKDMYDQALGTMALTEAYGLSKDEKLKQPAQKAVDFIVGAQNKDTGGWRYNPNDPGDTSVFGWQIMALKSARLAGLEVPDEVFEKAEIWLGKVGGGKHGGLYGYQNKSVKPNMTAESMFCRELLGTPRNSPMMKETVGYLDTKRLDASRITDFYYIYYGTLALYQYKGPVWEEWNRRLKPLLLSNQIKTGEHAGSWENTGQHGNRMGRVVSTAMATLSLEVYYRYLPLYRNIQSVEPALDK